MLEPDNVNTMPVAKQYLYYINHDVDRYKKELKVITVKTNKNSKKKEINKNFKKKVLNPPKFQIFIKCLKNLKFKIHMRNQDESLLRKKYDENHKHNDLKNDNISSRYVYTFDWEHKPEKFTVFGPEKVNIVVKYEVTPKDSKYYGQVTFTLTNASDLVYAYFYNCIYLLKGSPSEVKLKFILDGTPLKSLYIPKTYEKIVYMNNVNTLNVNTLNVNTLYYIDNQPVVFVYKNMYNHTVGILKSRVHLYVNIKSKVHFTGNFKSQLCYFVKSEEYVSYINELGYMKVEKNLYNKPTLFDISKVFKLKRNAAHHLSN